jgi:hypothetical protein
MGPNANVCGLLLGLAGFAAWMFARREQSQHTAWMRWLGGIGVLALFLSAVSPDDDLFQQELIRPAIRSANVFTYTRALPRWSFGTFLIHTPNTTEPILVPRAGHSFVVDQRPDFRTLFATAILVHSPPRRVKS